MHRLFAGVRKVDDGESAMAERHARLSPVSAAIGPAMREGVGHAPGECAEVASPAPAANLETPGYSTHFWSSRAKKHRFCRDQVNHRTGSTDDNGSSFML